MRCTKLHLLLETRVTVPRSIESWPVLVVPEIGLHILVLLRSQSYEPQLFEAKVDL